MENHGEGYSLPSMICVVTKTPEAAATVISFPQKRETRQGE